MTGREKWHETKAKYNKREKRHKTKPFERKKKGRKKSKKKNTEQGYGELLTQFTTMFLPVA